MSYDQFIPIVAWDSGESVELECSSDGSTYIPITVSLGYGFGVQIDPDPVGDALIWSATDSMARAIAIAVDAVLGGAAVTSQYRTGAGSTRFAWRIQRGTGDVYLRSDLTTMRKIGISTTTIRFRGSSDPTETWSDLNWPGVFAPPSVAGKSTPELDILASQIVSVFDASVAATTRLSRQDTISLQWPNVPTRYVNETWARFAIYAAACGCSVVDSNNLLSGMFSAAADGTTFRLWTERGEASYIDARLKFDRGIQQERHATPSNNFQWHTCEAQFVEI